ncbi:hypothetical protein RD792_015257 [Penstemon davidsonii]|uniref:Large ribosomal RNA subunit accumulation protein YCED homolog 1, chloroplastic n=1 Tax=Penstemon davidsonii TaxID=160366 RepID=A0ABR0CSM1_9LAMI|nr:hypothetical protein RD792_015257 [Penstemon davidsonii]
MMLLHPFTSSSSSSPSTASLLPSFPLTQYAKPFKLVLSKCLKKRFNRQSNFTLTKTRSSSSSFQFTNNDWEFEEGIEEDDDEGCPWAGAVMYKRNASVSHLEYCTTLESLGLAKLSSDVSKTRASQMGLRVIKSSVKDYPNGTPVLISLEVIRKKHKLRLDGIVRTVISLNCNRCGEPAAQSVYSELSILLCEEPIKEPETINMGVIFGEDKYKSSGINEEDNYDEDSLIDLEDQLYFPVDEKVIDISKNIRDLIHVEITITAICDPKCKGLCLSCGSNLNNSNCTCGTNEVQEKGYGPIGSSLRKQMQQT